MLTLLVGLQGCKPAVFLLLALCLFPRQFPALLLGLHFSECLGSVVLQVSYFEGILQVLICIGLTLGFEFVELRLQGCLLAHGLVVVHVGRTSCREVEVAQRHQTVTDCCDYLLRLLPALAFLALLLGFGLGLVGSLLQCRYLLVVAHDGIGIVLWRHAQALVGRWGDICLRCRLALCRCRGVLSAVLLRPCLRAFRGRFGLWWLFCPYLRTFGRGSGVRSVLLCKPVGTAFRWISCAHIRCALSFRTAWTMPRLPRPARLLQWLVPCLARWH